MKLAILGADEDSLDLIRWEVSQNGAGQGAHELVAAYDSDPFAEQLRALAPQIRLNQSWEELAVASSADAVIIGRGGKYLTDETGIDHTERRADQLRKLVQAAVPMIVVCPACEAIVGFEIEMIRRDVGAIIVPYVAGASNPVINLLSNLAAMNESSEIGMIEQVFFEREQADRGRDAVRLRFSRDVTLLRGVIGFVQAVTASGPPVAVGRDPLGPKPKDLPSLANLSVFLGGSEGLNARWSIAPTAGADQARLILVGQRGRAVASMPGDHDWSLEVMGPKRTTKTFSAQAGTEDVFLHLANEMARGDAKTFDLWHSFCRDQEAAEAVDRSLARGRTIELFNEQHTEEDSFKGIMAMGGCFLLVLSLGFVFLAAIVEGLQLPMREWRIWQPWPFYLLIPLGAFLLLQFLQLAIKRDAPAAN